MPESAIFAKLGISCLLGLLVGIQREHSEAGIGIRSFALIPVLGTVCALLADSYGGWILAAGFLGIAGVLVGMKVTWLSAEDFSHGTTTEMAALLMYVVGAMLVAFPMAVGVAVGGGVAVLLQVKPQLHRIVRKLGESDVKAIMQFVLITCIILPVLPNETYGPFHVFNPFETWLLVALIVGMNLVGYIGGKFAGQNAGILLGGALGGAVSSTATTVSYSRQAKSGQIGNAAASVAILIASTVVYGRVAVAVAVVAPEFLRSLIVPLAILILLTAVPTVMVWLRVRGESVTMPEQENPTQLKAAVLFGVMYAGVLIALAAGQRYFGGQGLYAVSALSGLTDMDAITLSTARLARANDPMVLQDGWRMIVTAILSNLVFKAGIVGLTLNGRLFLRTVLLFAIPFAGGILLLIYGGAWSLIGG